MVLRRCGTRYTRMVLSKEALKNGLGNLCPTYYIHDLVSLFPLTPLSPVNVSLGFVDVHPAYCTVPLVTSYRLI